MSEVRTEVSTTPLPLRNDTILGVCEALGQDLGVNANWLRVLFCLALYVSPAAVAATYIGLGAAVAISRLVYPPQRGAAAASEQQQQQRPANDESRSDNISLAA